MNLIATQWTDKNSGFFIEITNFNPDGTCTFAVRDCFGSCLNTNFIWDEEPMPSERSLAFLESHRFHCWEAAASALERALADYDSQSGG